MDDDIKMVDGEFYAKCEYCGTWVIGLIKCCDECARKNWVPEATSHDRNSVFNKGAFRESE